MRLRTALAAAVYGVIVSSHPLLNTSHPRDMKLNYELPTACFRAGGRALADGFSLRLSDREAGRVGLSSGRSVPRKRGDASCAPKRESGPESDRGPEDGQSVSVTTTRSSLPWNGNGPVYMRETCVPVSRPMSNVSASE